MRQSWRSFRHGKPGRRFQDRYYRRHRSGRWRLSAAGFLNLGFGAALALAGFFMVLAPGPGWITVFVGLALISGELLPVARFLDRLEVRLREISRELATLWINASDVTKAGMLLSALAGLATLGYVAFHLLSG